MPEKRWITVKECSSYLGLHVVTVYRLLGKEIPYSRVGRNLRIDLKKLNEIMESRMEKQ